MPTRAFRLPGPCRTARLLAAAALAGGLSACGSDLPKFPPACPQTSILEDGADLTVYRGAGADLTDMVLDGRITGINGKCSLDDLTHLRTVVSVSLDLTRGPAATGRDAQATYFVSVAQGDRILDKQDFTAAITFPRNANRVRLSGDQVELVLPVDEKVGGAAYSIRVGFQLTPEQLAFNRRRGPR